MTELERALFALGRELDVPAAPDVAAAVRGRIGRPRRHRRRLLAAGALAVLLAVAVALAIPPARGAILRFLHIRGAEVALVDRLPPTPARGTPPGTPGTLGDAPFRVLLPDGERPDAVYLFPGGVWLRYGPPERPRLLVAELSGDGTFLKKVAATATNVRYANVGGEAAIWIEGAPHRLGLPGGDARLAGNTLLWQHGPLTLRLEGDLDLEQARALALAFR